MLAAVRGEFATGTVGIGVVRGAAVGATGTALGEGCFVIEILDLGTTRFSSLSGAG